jgi:DNA-binding MarR family transcriptional regulator
VVRDEPGIQCITTLNVVQQVVEPDDPLVDSLLAASRGLVGIAARSLASTEDVTLPQYRALVLIASRPFTTVSDLAAALGIHPTTATRLCDRLVRKRYIRRAEGTEDRRNTELHLAAAGRRLVDRVTTTRRRDIATIASRMDRDDVEDLVRILDAFSGAANELGADDLFGWDTPG